MYVFVCVRVRTVVQTREKQVNDRAATYYMYIHRKAQH